MVDGLNANDTPDGLLPASDDFDDVADDGDDGDDRARIPWELPEIVLGGLLITVALLAVTGLAGGIVASLKTADSNFLLGDAIVVATGWAGPFSMALLLAGLGLVWWQVEGWGEVTDTWLDDDDGTGEGADDSDTDDLVESLRHLWRARMFVTWTAVLVGIVALASLTRLVGIGLNIPPGSPVSNQIWGNYIVEGGSVVATLVLVAASLYVVVQLRRLCDVRLKIDDGDDDEDL